jgi:uncharacterized membrane protein (DUF485 family)
MQGQYFSWCLAIAYSLVIASLAKLTGFKFSQFQADYSSLSKGRRAVDGIVIGAVFVFVIGLIILLSQAREWAATTLSDSPPDSTPAFLAWAFGALGALAYVSCVVMNHWIYQDRIARVTAYRALKRERNALDASIAKHWTPLAARRDGIIALWRAKHDEASAAARLDISKFNYAAASENTDGVAFPSGYLHTPPEFHTDPRFPQRADLEEHLRRQAPLDRNLFN